MTRKTYGHVTYFVAARVDGRAGYAPENWRGRKPYEAQADAERDASKRHGKLGTVHEVYAVDDNREPWLVHTTTGGEV